MGIPVIAILKDRDTHRMSLDHLFDVDAFAEDLQEKRLWMRIRPRAAYPGEINPIRIAELINPRSAADHPIAGFVAQPSSSTSKESDDQARALNHARQRPTPAARAESQESELQEDLAKLDDEARNGALEDTEYQQLVSARIGQGDFRKSLLERYDGHCAVTGVSVPEALRASHIKPWRHCVSKHERLDPHNGLLLVAHIDALFDRGLITFEDRGQMLVSPRVSAEQRRLLGIPKNVRSFSEKQKLYLKHHREVVFQAQ